MGLVSSLSDEALAVTGLVSSLSDEALAVTGLVSGLSNEALAVTGLVSSRSHEPLAVTGLVSSRSHEPLPSQHTQMGPRWAQRSLPCGPYMSFPSLAPYRRCKWAPYGSHMGK